MKGDYSRSSFRAERHYASVRQQQGRVQLDADGNEAQDIVGHRLDVTTRDVIGAAGAPIDNAGFGLTLDGTGKLLSLSAGRLYVDGVLVENEAAVQLPVQPHLAGGWALLPNGPAGFDVAALPAGDYAVVVDVWPRHISVLEEPSLIEPALNGVDTTTRVQTVWQIKLMPVPAGTTCAAIAALDVWKFHAAPSSGKLFADTDQPPPSSNACDLSPSGGYQGLENQLYRVEIHQAGGAGGAGAATFKWATDNASLATLATAWDGNKTVSVASTGRDFSISFKIGDTVELLESARELRGRPGTLRTIADMDGNALILSGKHDLGVAASGDSAAARGVRVRRWAGAAQNVPATGNQQKLGDDGVVVTFDKTEGVTYRTGDYWTIPARTALADVDWPSGYQSPDGIAHRFALIGRFHINSVAQISQLTDCRDLFPPLTAMIDFDYAGGDGQQAEPRETGNSAAIPLAYPLQVSVARGKLPVAGMKVHFAIESGAGGTLGVASDGTVTTQANGIASCPWSLAAGVGDTPQRVVAKLLDDGMAAVGMPIRFGARVLGLLDMRLNGGDTQVVQRSSEETGPFSLPSPLRVAVLRAGRSAKNQIVRFEVTGGGGTLNGGGLTTVDVSTDDSGIAQCNWRITDAGDASVRARLMKDAGTPWGLPDVSFTATVLTVTATGGCDVTVGEDGEFRTIEAALKFFIDKGIRNICLCLKPGRHFITDALKVPPDKGMALAIHGCGQATTLTLRGVSLTVEEIGAFVMHDLTMQMLGGHISVIDTPIVTLRRISADLREDIALLDVQNVAALTIEGCKLITEEKFPALSIDNFEGSRRIIGNEIVGTVNFAKGELGSVGALLPKLRRLVSEVLQNGSAVALPPPSNLLTIADNQITAIVVGQDLLEAMIKNETIKPRATRVEGNVLTMDGNIVPGAALIFQANTLLSSGENLLLGTLPRSDNNMFTKILANVGVSHTLISSIGYFEEILNRPVVVNGP